LYVKRHELGAGCGEDTVEEQFGGLEVGSFGGDFAGVVDFVAADRYADALGLCFGGRSAKTILG
jgi:hypothetical protein